MSARPIEVVLGRLNSPKRAGSQFQARCPSHSPDKDPSLFIKEARDGRVLLKCFGGCKTPQVVAALGLTMADLFPRRGRRFSTYGEGDPFPVGSPNPSVSQWQRTVMDWLRSEWSMGKPGWARRADLSKHQAERLITEIALSGSDDADDILASGRWLEKATGINRGKALALRRVLLESGWLKDTGRRTQGGGVVYWLEIPPTGVEEGSGDNDAPESKVGEVVIRVSPTSLYSKKGIQEKKKNETKRPPREEGSDPPQDHSSTIDQCDTPEPQGP